MDRIGILISVFRPKRWYRNAFMLLGSVMAVFLNQIALSDAVYAVAISFIAICLVASGNYGLNEVCDAETDKYHPQKKFRALPSGRVKVSTVIFASLVLYALGLLLAWQLHNGWVLGALGLFIFTTGILYNIPPWRLKDVPFLDFILESFGNPVRLLVGWYAVTTRIVPVSFILIFWCVGMLLMAGKRFAELKFLGGGHDTQLYRKSLGKYTEEQLLLSMIAASALLMYMFGVLSVKHEIDLVIMLPLVVGFLVWFFHLAHQPNSIIKDPERVFENRPFVIYSLVLVVVFFLLLYFKFNYFSFLLNH
ncbi:MAG: UbiA family prenyltransferase [bacterium]|nr:UbiA family prenyltransferase [bacterium]